MTDSAPIQPLDLAAERAFLGAPLHEAVRRVIDSGHYVLGPEVEVFERNFARLHGVAHGVGVASGTDALILGLRALGVGAGDAVLTTPFTFFASAGCIEWIGARPVLVDVEPETALLDPERTAERLAAESDVACILPVHLYGQLADMRALRELAVQYDTSLLEDGAQAHGARRDGCAVGELGDLATFSFYPTKNLGAAGEGGMVLTNDDELEQKLRRLRDHGSRVKYEHAELGTNSRLQAIQAAVLNVKLGHLEAWNSRRRDLAARYDAAFANDEVVHPLVRPTGSEPVYHQYAVRVRGGPGRDAVQAGLAEQAIHAAIHYPRAVHLQEAARKWGYREGDFPVAEGLAREVLCLPIHPFLAEADVDRVAEAVLALARG